MFDAAGKEKMVLDHEVALGYPKENNSHSFSRESENAIHVQKDGQVAPAYDFVKTNNSMFWDPHAVVNQGYIGQFYRPEAYPLPFHHPDMVMLRQFQRNSFANKIYPMNQEHFDHIENRFSYMPPVNMYSHAHPHQSHNQEFEYFVVIDFEATCDKDSNLHPQEIIEFPSVLVNSTTGKLEADFQTYVRPAYHQNLTDFCKELTGIQQIQVDGGVPLSEALFIHDKWLEKKGIKQQNFVVVTWSNWDCRVMLESECRYKRIRKPPYFNRWINLKVPFQEMFEGVRCNLKEAVQIAGLAWEGRAHCGLDDARNTARLLVHLMERGFKFSITNYLASQYPEFPINYEPFREVLLDHNQQSPKPKEPVCSPVQFHPYGGPGGKERQTYCYCGVLSSKCVVRKPGPTQGRCFFGCGNWTASRRAVCNYFTWASP